MADLGWAATLASMSVWPGLDSVNDARNSTMRADGTWESLERTCSDVVWRRSRHAFGQPTEADHIKSVMACLLFEIYSWTD